LAICLEGEKQKKKKQPWQGKGEQESRKRKKRKKNRKHPKKKKKPPRVFLESASPPNIAASGEKGVPALKEGRCSLYAYAEKKERMMTEGKKRPCPKIHKGPREGA